MTISVKHLGITVYRYVHVYGNAKGPPEFASIDSYLLWNIYKSIYITHGHRCVKEQTGVKIAINVIIMYRIIKYQVLGKTLTF